MPTRVTFDESSSLDRRSYDWDKITHSLEPETSTLPEADRRYFESKLKLLIGKEIRLSNIPSNFMDIYHERSDWIFQITRYPMLLPDEFIRSEIGKMLFRLGIRISEDGLGWKFGPMGFQQSSMRQEIIGIPREG